MRMSQEQILSVSSASMDLKRAALGYYRNSLAAADRFAAEALKRMDEVNTKGLKPYLKAILLKARAALNERDREKLAEDALMYSTLLQNSVVSEKTPSLFKPQQISH